MRRVRKPARRGLVVTVALFAATMIGVGLTAMAAAFAQQEAGEVYSTFNGRQTYKTFCVNCHGVDAKGDGYLADSLKVKPTDLTALARKSGGEFPADRVKASIDGRVSVKGHGMREMPVWGDAFVWPEDDSPERRAQVKQRIGELVAFLATIQEPTPPPPAPKP